MNPYNCTVTIERLTGTESSKVYTEVALGVRAMIIAANNAIVALYEMPIGSGYTYMVLNQVTTIQAADQLIVTDPMSSGLAINDTFVVQGNSKRIPGFGAIVTEGVCIKT